MCNNKIMFFKYSKCCVYNLFICKIIVIEFIDSLVVVCNRCVKSLVVLFLDIWFNICLKKSLLRLRFLLNVVGFMSFVMYFYNCGMLIFRFLVNLNICLMLKREYKEIIRVKWILLLFFYFFKNLFYNGWVFVWCLFY